MISVKTEKHVRTVKVTSFFVNTNYVYFFVFVLLLKERIKHGEMPM